MADNDVPTAPDTPRDSSAGPAAPPPGCMPSTPSLDPYPRARAPAPGLELYLQPHLNIISHHLGIINSCLPGTSSTVPPPGYSQPPTTTSLPEPTNLQTPDTATPGPIPPPSSAPPSTDNPATTAVLTYLQSENASLWSQVNHLGNLCREQQYWMQKMMEEMEKMKLEMGRMGEHMVTLNTKLFEAEMGLRVLRIEMKEGIRTAAAAGGVEVGNEERSEAAGEVKEDTGNDIGPEVGRLPNLGRGKEGSPRGSFEMV